MRKALCGALFFLMTIPLLAGDLHGKVACKGARDSADALVSLTPVPPKSFPAPKEHAKINQENLIFHPRVLPVLVGTTVDFLNSDALMHNVFSPDACAEKFNLGTWPKGEIRSHEFKKECVAALLCKVHAEMEAFVVVMPTPYFVVTQADGNYRIPNVPDGAYSVKVWHPKLKGTQKPVTVAGATAADFEISR